MAEDSPEDPWDWGTDRVIQELCTDARSWTPRSNNPAIFPDKGKLEESLRDHGVDGECLLLLGHDDSFYADLNIKNMRHKLTIRTAIDQFRRRSTKYRNHELGDGPMDIEDEKPSNGTLNEDARIQKLLKERQSHNEPEIPESTGSSHVNGDFDYESRKRKLMLERMSQPELPGLDENSGVSGIPTAPSHGQVPASPLVADAESTPEDVSRKKRRIAPVTLSTNVDVNAIRNIPTEADVVLERMRNVASGLDTPVNIRPSEAYLGGDSLNRVEILNINSPVSAEQLTDEDKTFQFLPAGFTPAGRLRQVNQMLRRQLLGRQRPTQVTSSKTDMVPGADNPDHDAVLPAYGESDDEEEYDSDTWEEIQNEQRERESRPADNVGLSLEEVNAVIDDTIQEHINLWYERKLPALNRKAYTIWRKTRGSSLKPAIDKQQLDLDRYETRLKKYREDVIHQTWFKREDLKEILRSFEVTIEDRQKARWTIQILKSPQAPERHSAGAHVPASRITKPRTDRPVAADEESLGSDSEDDPRGFIDDDDVEHGAAKDAQTDIEMVDGAPDSMEDDQALDSFAGDKVDSSEDSNPAKDVPAPVADIVMTGTSDGEADDEETPLDLTQIETPPKKSQASTPRRPKPGIPTIDLITPEGRTPRSGRMLLTVHPKSSPRDFPPEFVLNMTKGEKLAAEQLARYGEEYLEYIFALAKTFDVDTFWKDFLLPALHVDIPKGPPFPPDSDRTKDTWFAHVLLRLLATFTSERTCTTPEYKVLLANNKWVLMEKSSRVPELVAFIRKVSTFPKGGASKLLLGSPGSAKSTKFKPKAPSGLKPVEVEVEVEGDVDEPENEEDEDEEPADAPPKKRKPIKRDRAAQNLRESDRRRVEQQAERRRILHEKLRAEGLSTAASQKANLIINESKEDDQGFIYVHEKIAERIKDHQVEGVRFMWNQVVQSSQTRQGCLLAHTMGLGKTMQIITLLVAISDAAASDDPAISDQIPEDFKNLTALVLAPAGLVANWVDEFLIWAPEGHNLGEFFKIDAEVPKLDRRGIVEDWAAQGGVLIVGYPLFTALMQEDDLKDTVLDVASIVIADEAHMLKNPRSQVHGATSDFRTHSRIALTGSPLANNVQEYHAMISWVAPNYLSDLAEFRQDYSIPIEQGLAEDSSPQERRKALTKLRALKATIAPKVHRRTIAVLNKDIPPKKEFVLSVPLLSLQRQAYEIFMRHHHNSTMAENTRVFASLNVLALLCNHPSIFRTRLLEEREKTNTKTKKKPSDEVNKDPTATAILPSALVSEELSLLRTKEIEREDLSWKITLLLKILKESKSVGDGVLVFSQSIPTLLYLHKLLRQKRKAVVLLDGKTAIQNRQAMVKSFNQGNADIFLISTNAGGLGLNITGANRVVIFDFKFNPQQEQQAVGRAYRIGQVKPVFVYRFVCGGTCEEKLQQRAVFKLQLSSRVVDKKNPIPRGQRFGDLFVSPTDPVQKDLTPYLGKDKILDSIINNPECHEGLRSIVMTDSFEEEDLESSDLTPEEKQEADRLVSQHTARLAGQPWVDLIGTHGAVTTPVPTAAPTTVIATAPSTVPPQGHRFLPTAVSEKPGVNVNNGDMQPSSSRNQSTVPLSAQADPTIPQPPQATDQTIESGPVLPVLGSSTQIRQPSTRNNPTFNVKQFKGELVRAFGKGADMPLVKDKRRRTAEAIAASFGDQAGKQDSASLNKAMWAVLDAAKSTRFIEAMVTGILSPSELSLHTAQAIQAEQGKWDQMSQEEWDNIVGPKYYQGDPEKTQNSVYAASTTKHTGQRKSHASDDQTAMQELISEMGARQGSANGNSRERPPRLPNWAKAAVASGGMLSSSSASPGPSNPKPTARNPFR